jgi:CDP-diacylglycerol---glycerol-3-phosphate 3-phosphatidyltransferase
VTGRTPVAPGFRASVRHRLEPLALALARLGLSPNRLTLLGFAIAIVGAALAVAELWVLAGIVATAGAAFDLRGGAVARATGRVSRLGAFMDSTFDRWGEGVVYVGIVVGASRAGLDVGAWLAAAAMASAFMVSYSRAKSESLGFTSGTGMAAVGLAPREVRTIILGVALVAAGLLGNVTGDLAGGSLALVGGLTLITLLATITTIQRVAFVARQADEQGGP